MLRIKREEIESKRATRAQLAAWGVHWPPKKGWKSALIRGLDPNTAPIEREDAEQQATLEMLEMRKLYEEKSRGMEELDVR